MFIKKLTLGILETNCYILSGDGKGAVIIDPAEYYDEIKRTLDSLHLTAVAVLLTHGHLDHTNAAKQLQDGGARIYMNYSDRAILGNHFGFGYPLPVKTFEPDKALTDGEVLQLAGLDIRVLFTPGHTKGSVCYMIEDILFSGDTLFHLCVGRTDLPSGNENAIMQSVQRLYKLPPETRVFAGHDKETTIGSEAVNNHDIKKSN